MGSLPTTYDGLKNDWTLTPTVIQSIQNYQGSDCLMDMCQCDARTFTEYANQWDQNLVNISYCSDMGIHNYVSYESIQEMLEGNWATSTPFTLKSYWVYVQINERFSYVVWDSKLATPNDNCDKPYKGYYPGHFQNVGFCMKELYENTQKLGEDATVRHSEYVVKEILCRNQCETLECPAHRYRSNGKCVHCTSCGDTQFIKHGTCSGTQDAVCLDCPQNPWNNSQTGYYVDDWQRSRMSIFNDTNMCYYNCPDGMKWSVPELQEYPIGSPLKTGPGVCLPDCTEGAIGCADGDSAHVNYCRFYMNGTCHSECPGVIDGDKCVPITQFVYKECPLLQYRSNGTCVDCTSCGNTQFIKHGTCSGTQDAVCLDCPQEVPWSNTSQNVGWDGEAIPYYRMSIFNDSNSCVYICPDGMKWSMLELQEYPSGSGFKTGPGVCLPDCTEGAIGCADGDSAHVNYCRFYMNGTCHSECPGVIDGDKCVPITQTWLEQEYKKIAPC